MICVHCQYDFVSDQTPMAADGYCLFCRPAIGVVCARCGAPCPGAFDGQKRCLECRSAQLGEQQYEDEQQTRYRWLVEQGVITPSGDVNLSLTAIESLLNARTVIDEPR